MIVNDFYPNYQTYGGTTSTNFPNDLTEFTDKGYSAYYMGYITHDSLPTRYKVSKYETDLVDNIGTVTCAVDDPNANYDFLYAGAWQVALGQTSGLQSQNPQNTIGQSGNTRIVTALNQIGYAQIVSDYPRLVFACIYRSGVDVTQYTDSGYVTADLYDATSSDLVLNWLKGNTTATLTFQINGDNLEIELNAADFDSGYKAFHTTVDSKVYDGVITIFNCILETKNDKNWAYGFGYCGKVRYNLDDYIFYTNGTSISPYIAQSSTLGNFKIERATNGSGTSAYLNIPHINTLNNLITINDTSYIAGGIDLNFSETLHSVFNTIYISGNTVFYRAPDYTAYYTYRRWICFTMHTADECLMFLATFPKLPDYYPLFDGNRLTGDFFPSSELPQKGTGWQITGNITDNIYTEDDKPPYVPPTPDDDEITIQKHNDADSLPVIAGIRTVSGDAFSTFYHLSMYHVAELGNLISQMPQTFWEALGTATDIKQSNLLDYLVSLKWYPLNIVDSTDTVTSDIQFGFNGIAKITFTAPGTSYKIGNINRVYHMGSITIPYRTTSQNFLDLEPYTSVSAYLPYIGTVNLQANDVIGYTITCTYIIDLTTGMCTGILDNGIDTIYIGTGKIGVDISISGNDVLTQSEKMASSYMGAAAGAVNNTLSIAASAAAGDVAGLISSSVSSITELASSAISIANSKRGLPETVGIASGFGGVYTHQSPYIRVQRPAVSIPGKYGHDVGYVCNRSYSIGSLSGFTVCQNPDLSGIPATSAELDMIKSILCTGFYA